MICWNRAGAISNMTVASNLIQDCLLAMRSEFDLDASFQQVQILVTAGLVKAGTAWRKGGGDLHLEYGPGAFGAL